MLQRTASATVRRLLDLCQARFRQIEGKIFYRGDADVSEGVLCGEADVDGEEGVGGGSGADDKLHGAGAVGVVDEVNAPQQHLLARVVVVVAIHLAAPARFKLQNMLSPSGEQLDELPLNCTSLGSPGLVSDNMPEEGADGTCL